MTEVDVLWFVEHIAREMDVACAARAYLQKQGISVKVVPFLYTPWRDLTYSYRPKVLVVPYAYGIKWGNMPRYLPFWRDARIFSVAWEQMYEKAYEEIKRPADAFVREHVIHHAWGEFFKTYLLDSGVPDGNIFLNGHPAYQLYEQPYSKAFKNREKLAAEFCLDPQRRWLFFPETYSWAFRDQKWIDTQVEWGIDLQLIRDMQDFCVSSLRLVLGWLVRLAQNEKVEIIIRPRPSTSKDDFLRFAQAAQDNIPANIHFNQAYSVREWILASDVVASSHSTSLIESAISHRPTFAIQPLALPQAMRSAWMDYPQCITNEDDFLSYCMGQKVDQAGQQRFENWARSTFLGNGDAIYRLVEQIKGLVESQLSTAAVISEAELEAIIPHGYKNYRAYQAMPALQKAYLHFRSQMENFLKYGLAKRESIPVDYFTDGDVAQRTHDFAKVI